jgi:DNA-binding Xre family transcriptional regulator
MITFKPMKDYLEKIGVTKYQLIKKGILTQADINRIELNHNYTFKFINKLCHELNCKVEDLISYEEDKHEN